MIRIAITGPESSGKTTIAKVLAEELSGQLVSEYSREYLMNNIVSLPYKITDLIEIAQEQYKRNLGTKQKKGYLICDTEITVIKIWAEDKFQICPKGILELYENQKFDLYFLCSPDFPWQYDPLREDFGRRDYLFERYFDELTQKGRMFYVLSGSVANRLEEALAIIHQKYHY